MNDHFAYMLCGVSVVFYGSMYVPFRGRRLADGIFIQWVQTVTMFVVACTIYAARAFPTIHALSLLSGMLWSVGNLFTVPMIECLGTGLGALVRGTVQIVVGWATGRFGLFGLREENKSNGVLEFTGVLLTIFSAAFFALVRTTPTTITEDEAAIITGGDVDSDESTYGTTDDYRKEQSALSRMERQRRTERVILGFLFAGVSGVLYGEQLTPLQYLHEHSATLSSLDHIFGFACGALATSTLVFVTYMTQTVHVVHTDRSLIVPSIVYGLMFSVAIFTWFVSNDELSQSITYPINARLPNLIVAAWAVLYFQEISGGRNLILLIVGSVVAVVGVLLMAMAK